MWSPDASWTISNIRKTIEYKAFNKSLSKDLTIHLLIPINI
jgi:hypothetical protein